MNKIEENAEYDDLNSIEHDNWDQPIDEQENNRDPPLVFSEDSIDNEWHTFEEEEYLSDEYEHDGVIDVEGVEHSSSPLRRSRRVVKSSQKYLADKFDRFPGIQKRYSLAAQMLMKDTF